MESRIFCNFFYQWRAIRASKDFSAGPNILRKGFFLTVHVILYPLGDVASSVVYYNSFHSVIFLLACVVRFCEICLRTSESTEKALVMANQISRLQHQGK